MVILKYHMIMYTKISSFILYVLNIVNCFHDYVLESLNKSISKKSPSQNIKHHDQHAIKNPQYQNLSQIMGIQSQTNNKFDQDIWVRVLLG